MDQLLNLPETEHELASVRQGQPRTWAELARLLASVETLGLWRVEADSFTEWLKRFAKTLGKTESLLWRYLSSGRYYLDLRKKLPISGFDCPLLENLPEKVGAENLELLAKLERVVPPDEFQNLSERVVTGVATRAELRHAWSIYRPVLAGQTARRQPIPKYDPNDLSQCDSMLEALAFRALTANKGDWLGNDTLPDIYQVFTHVPIRSPHARNIQVVFDAVIVSGARDKGQPLLHGIEITNMAFPGTDKKLIRLAGYCDRMWAMLYESSFADSMDARTIIPEPIGILMIDGSRRIKVLRQAAEGVGENGRCYALAKTLLLKIPK